MGAARAVNKPTFLPEARAFESVGLVSIEGDLL